MAVIAGDKDSTKITQQKKKDGILKKLSDKKNARSKWGSPASPAVPSAEDGERSKWRGPPASVTSTLAQEEDEPPDTSRSQWGDGKHFRLSQLPLEETASAMESTSVTDQVVKIASETVDVEMRGKDGSRGQWSRGSEGVRALDRLPIRPDTVVIEKSQLGESPKDLDVSAPRGVGATIVLSSQAPSTSATTTSTGGATITLATDTTKQTTTPLPPERSGTVIISKESISNPAYKIPVVPSSPQADDHLDSSDKSQNNTLNETELPSSLRFIENKTASSETGEALDHKKDLYTLTEVSESQALTKGEKSLKQESDEKSNTGIKQSDVEDNEPNSQSSPITDKNVRKSDESVRKTLTTGKFDIQNLQLMRTISEPDLAVLFRTLDHNADQQKGDNLSTTQSVKRHHSLDLTATSHNNDLDLDKDNDDEDDDFAEMTIQLPEDDDNNEDDEDDDLISMRESMQSILIDSQQEDKTVKFRLSDSGDNAIDSIDGTKTKSSTLKAMGDKDNDVGSDDDDDEDDDEADVAEQEKQELAAALNLENEDESEDEAMFGDAADDEDYDRFGRLEQCRAELETELGVDLLRDAYQAIQQFQEDENMSMEEGTQIAMEILGSEKEKLFPKIFQLVLSDMAFTEDNE